MENHHLCSKMDVRCSSPMWLIKCALWRTGPDQSALSQTWSFSKNHVYSFHPTKGLYNGFSKIINFNNNYCLNRNHYEYLVLIYKWQYIKQRSLWCTPLSRTENFPTLSVFLLMLFIRTKNIKHHLQELKLKDDRAAWNSTHKFMRPSS